MLYLRSRAAELKDIDCVQNYFIATNRIRLPIFFDINSNESLRGRAQLRYSDRLEAGFRVATIMSMKLRRRPARPRCHRPLRHYGSFSFNSRRSQGVAVTLKSQATRRSETVAARQWRPMVLHLRRNDDPIGNCRWIGTIDEKPLY